jgi:hypothetical protein
MVESMVALTLADALLQHVAQCELFPRDFAFGRSEETGSGVVHNRLGKLLQLPTSPTTSTPK